MIYFQRDLFEQRGERVAKGLTVGLLLDVVGRKGDFLPTSCHLPIEIAERDQIVGADQNMQNAGLCGHRLDPIELVFGLLAIAGECEVLCFIQDHGADAQPPKLFFIRVTQFRVILVRCRLLAGGFPLYRPLSIVGIHLDPSAKRLPAQAPQSFPVIVGAIE